MLYANQLAIEFINSTTTPQVSTRHVAVELIQQINPSQTGCQFVGLEMAVQDVPAGAFHFPIGID